MKIYTRKGDTGSTSLIGGTRVSKNHIRIEAYGTVDELNSWIGLLADVIPGKKEKQILIEIQDRLFVIGSLLAADPQRSKMKLPMLNPQDITRLEQEIDRMQSRLSPLRFFILPGGHTKVSYCHIARCVCRRAERRISALPDALSHSLVLAFINRLSDYLFVLARYTAKKANIAERPWIPRH